MHLKIRIFIFVFALLLIAPDRYAFATSYDMFVYSDIHYSYVVQGIEVQKRILDAFSGGALLPVLVIFFVYCLFMWVRRISEKGDVLNFAVWFFAFFIISYMTFSAKTDIRMNIYKWEESTKTQHVNYFTTIEDAPGINSFFAQATEFVTILTHAILGRTAGKETADVIASCNPLDWYIKGTNTTLAHIATDKRDPNRSMQMFEDLRRPDFSFFVQLERFSFSPIEVIETTYKVLFKGRTNWRDWQMLRNEIIKNAKKCNVPDSLENCVRDRGVIKDKPALWVARNSVICSPFNNNIFRDYQQKLRDAPKHFKPVHDQVYRMADVGSALPIELLRDVISWLAMLMAQVQPGLNLNIYVMLMIQSIATAFFFLLFPFFLLFSFAAINDYTYGINWKVLIGFLVAFFLVQSWYPAIIFVKALVFRQFMM